MAATPHVRAVISSVRFSSPGLRSVSRVSRMTAKIEFVRKISLPRIVNPQIKSRAMRKQIKQLLCCGLVGAAALSAHAQAYSNAVVALHPVAYYPLNES